MGEPAQGALRGPGRAGERRRHGRRRGEAEAHRGCRGTRRRGAPAGDGRPSSAGADAAPPDASISAKKDDEWESSDDEGEGGSKGGRVALDSGALSDPTTGGGSDENDDDIIDEGPLDEYDRMLRARLFEAQRKSHQCTFRGVMAKGRALLEEEDDEEGE
jgi:hypothetical protein